jgi:predicted amidophosphoribosyltransferase
MFCLGCSYPLDGLDEHRCPECGRAFDPADPGTFVLKPLFVTSSSIEAEMLRDMLEDEGIEAHIEGASAGGAIGGPPVSVRVTGPDGQRAMTVLTTFLDSRRRLPKCPGCGYDLRGHADRGRCPECGREIYTGPAMLTCRECGERVPAGFEVCWNCGQAMTTDDEGK